MKKDIQEVIDTARRLFTLKPETDHAIKINPLDDGHFGIEI
jgi:hypothetical protein